ncbi:MAG: DUF2480 family protein [Bacteroidota bacterium]
MATELVNRVAKSGLITLKLEDFWPQQALDQFDLKDYLFMELILKEKDFRTAIKEHNWSQYQDKTLLVYCSTDAIIPVWAYMLVASAAVDAGAEVFLGQEEAFLQQHYSQAIAQIEVASYQDQRVVIKGCSDKEVPPSAYLEVTAKLRPYVRSIMYGEPCSTVPIYKRPTTR